MNAPQDRNIKTQAIHIGTKLPNALVLDFATHVKRPRQLKCNKSKKDDVRLDRLNRENWDRNQVIIICKQPSVPVNLWIDVNHGTQNHGTQNQTIPGMT